MSMSGFAASNSSSDIMPACCCAQRIVMFRTAPAKMLPVTSQLRRLGRRAAFELKSPQQPRPQLDPHPLIAFS